MKKLILFNLVFALLLSVSFSFGAYAHEQEETTLFSEETTSNEETQENDNTDENEEDTTQQDKENEEAPPVCMLEEVVPLEGKTIMMVGNSMLYYGYCVIYGDTGKEDYGYLYQLISANGESARVIDHTYSGKNLDYIYNNHLRYLSQSELEKVDYVVMAEANKENDNLLATCEAIMSLFPEKTEFLFMCNPMMHYNNIESLLAGVEQLREKDITIVDWGKLVYEIYSGRVKVPGALHSYDFCTFIIDNVNYSDNIGNAFDDLKGDTKHPNPLSGYISAQMVYSAITNRSALHTDYSFCNDSAINRRFDIDAFALKYYTGDKKTNFTDVFRSPADMFGIQTLIDKYLSYEGEHPLFIQKAVAPTCTSGGLSQGYYCSVCGETVKEQEYIQSKGGHKIKYTAAVAPTCTKEGKSGSAFCSVCNEIIIEEKSINALGHSNEETIVPATMKKDGYKLEVCSVCKLSTETQIKKIKSVTLSKKEYVYDGKSKTPKVIVTDSSGKELKADKDYTLIYPSDRTQIGDYKITVEFKGKYSGSETVVFKIRAGVTSEIKTKSYLKSVKLTWAKVNDATGYRVYVYNEKTKKYEKYKDTKKASILVKKLTSGKKYKFRVKAYTVIDGKKYLSGSFKFISGITKPAGVKLSSATFKTSKTVELKWKKVTGANGYQIAWSKDSKFKDSDKLLVKGQKSLSKNITKLTSGRKYYFKVRAYKELKGKKVYGAYSDVKSTTVRW